MSSEKGITARNSKRSENLGIVLEMDALISVVIGGAFTVLGVIIGWGLNEVSAARRLKPHLCFKLNSTPDAELVEEGLRTKTSSSEYCIEIYNVGQTPVILESFELTSKGQLIIQCPLFGPDMVILPFQSKTFVLMQRDAEALEWHSKELGFKQCKVTAIAVDGKQISGNLDVSWVHMRATMRDTSMIVY